MDNIFEYIIAAFFLFSLLSSLGKKKNKNKMRKPMPGETPYERKESMSNRPTQQREKVMTRPSGGWGQPTSQPSPKDIFDMIFNEPEQIKKAPQNQPSMQQSETWDPVAEYEDKFSTSKMHTTIPEIDYDKLPAYDNLKISEKNKFPKLEQDIKGTKKDLKVIYEYNVLKDTRALGIRQKILNSKSLRDFIIISEILNKPKAFRR